MILFQPTPPSGSGMFCFCALLKHSVRAGKPAWRSRRALFKDSPYRKAEPRTERNNLPAAPKGLFQSSKPTDGPRTDRSHEACPQASSRWIVVVLCVAGHYNTFPHAEEPYCLPGCNNPRYHHCSIVLMSNGLWDSWRQNLQTCSCRIAPRSG